MSGLVQDLRYGLRMLLRSPGLSAAAILALALGIGANTAIFSVVNAVMIRPLPYDDPSRLLAIYQTWARDPSGHKGLSEDDVVALRGATGTLARVAAYANPGAGGLTLADGAGAELVRGTRATWELFDVLGTPPLLGRVFLPEDDRDDADPVVVLSHALWMRRFAGDPAVVGRSVVVDGRPHTIAGVMPPGFRFPRDGAADLWAIFRVRPSESRPPYYIRAIARARPDAGPGAIAAELQAIRQRIQERFPESPGDWTLRSGPLKDEMVGDVGPSLLILLGAVALVLLIATANIANLLLARATARRKEIAIRRALGAGRMRLARQLLTESLLLAGAGGLLGVVLALWGTDILVALGPRGLPRREEIGLDDGVLLYTAIVTVASGLLFGLAPVLTATRSRLSAALGDGGRGATDHAGRRLRNALVVGEVALAVTLLGGAGLLIKSLLRLEQVNPGFDTGNILTASLTLPAARYDSGAARSAFFERLVERAERLPGVEAAAVSMALPPHLLVMTNPYTVEGRPAPPGRSATAVPHLLISPGYFRALGVPLVRGRLFTAADVDGAPFVVVINDVMARQVFPGEDPVGRRLQLGDFDPRAPWGTIVGVVGDVKYSGLDQAPRPTMYTPYVQDSWWPAMYLVVRSRLEPAALARAVRAEVAALDTEVPVARVHTMRELLGESVDAPRFRTTLLGLFAAAALVLAVVGIYGILSYTVGQRTQEIGIRMAMGARGRDVLALVLRQGMALAGLGIGLGLAGAFAVSRALAGLLYGVRPGDPATLAAVGLLMGVVALVACALPARRAARVDPMVALRSE